MLTLPYYLNWNGQNTLIQRIFEMEPGQTIYDLNKKPSWFEVSILQDYKRYEATKDRRILNKGLSFWERKFGYTWLEPESEDAPVQLELYLQEKVNKDPQLIKQNTIEACRSGYKNLVPVLLAAGNELQVDWTTGDDLNGYSTVLGVLHHACANQTRSTPVFFPSNFPQLFVRACGIQKRTV